MTDGGSGGREGEGDAWSFLNLPPRIGDAVYLVTGNDHLDDPAWGITPLMTGAPDQVEAWLRAQPNPYELSVVTLDGRTLWARDYLGLPSN